VARTSVVTVDAQRRPHPEILADGPPVIVRAADPQFSSLLNGLFRRYPNKEWATFARFGWRDTPTGLVVTLVGVDSPMVSELDDSVPHVAIQEPYSLRMALAAETHPYAIGVVHSHPENYATYPSHIDDDMDSYYSTFFSSFAVGRPYISLIFSKDDNGLRATGRVFWKGEWRGVSRFAVEGSIVRVDGSRSEGVDTSRLTRLTAAFGADAAERLRDSTVAVIGAGGTGSPAVEILARAGVGHIITVDPDLFTASNLERVHGSIEADVDAQLPKVSIAARHVGSINPRTRVTAIVGALPQPEVVDAVIHADFILGCTDQQHSRLALSDLALRYLVPTIDVGVDFEGAHGRITGQIIQLVSFFAKDPCALCRRMIDPQQVSQELMTESERARRRVAAGEATARGDNPQGYWREIPQLNTVGYLTTVAGAMATGYIIGMLTQRFDLPFDRAQMNLSARFLDVTEVPDSRRDHCDCNRLAGTAEQGGIAPFVTAPSHWPRALTT
jgi:molybdopterin/thiamine biosynthesis adenylyltransferase/proteasome lid subunit RPN8/RPN11